MMIAGVAAWQLAVDLVNKGAKNDETTLEYNSSFVSDS